MNPGLAMIRDLFRGEDRKPALILLSSTVLVTAWWCLANQLPTKVPEPVASTLSHVCSAEITADLWGVFRVLGSGALLLGIVPGLLVKFAFRERLRDYGLQLGEAKLGLAWTTGLLPLFLFLGYASAQRPEYQAVYPLNDHARDCFLLHAAVQVVFYLAWEFHFRGFLLHGLKPRCGTTIAIWIQVMASVLAHLGKPESEIIGALGGGLFWGLLSARCRSLYWGFTQHWLLGLSLDYFLCHPLGG